MLNSVYRTPCSSFYPRYFHMNAINCAVFVNAFATLGGRIRPMLIHGVCLCLCVTQVSFTTVSFFSVTPDCGSGFLL